MKYTDYESGYPSAEDFYNYLLDHKDNISDILKIDTKDYTLSDKTGIIRVALKVKDSNGDWRIPKVDTDVFDTSFAPKSDKFPGKAKLKGNKYTRDCYEEDEDKNKSLKEGLTTSDARPVYNWAELFSDSVQELIDKALKNESITLPSASKAKKKSTGDSLVLPSKCTTFYPLVKKEGLYPSFEIPFSNKRWDKASKSMLKKSFTLEDGTEIVEEVLGVELYDETGRDDDALKVDICESNINQYIPYGSKACALVKIPKLMLHSKGISLITEIDKMTVDRGVKKEQNDYRPTTKKNQHKMSVEEEAELDIE